MQLRCVPACLISPLCFSSPFRRGLARLKRVACKGPVASSGLRLHLDMVSVNSPMSKGLVIVQKGKLASFTACLRASSACPPRAREAWQAGKQRQTQVPRAAASAKPAVGLDSPCRARRNITARSCRVHVPGLPVLPAQKMPGGHNDGLFRNLCKGLASWRRATRMSFLPDAGFLSDASLALSSRTCHRWKA